MWFSSTNFFLFVYLTTDACGSELHDFHSGLCSLTPTEKEQSDEVLRGEIIKVGTTYSTNEHNPF